MSGELILGIDGGGSKVLVALADRTGRILRSSRGGGVNPMDNPNWRQELDSHLQPFLQERQLAAVAAALPRLWGSGPPFPSYSAKRSGRPFRLCAKRCSMTSMRPISALLPAGLVYCSFPARARWPGQARQQGRRILACRWMGRCESGGQQLDQACCSRPRQPKSRWPCAIHGAGRRGVPSPAA